MPKVVQTCLELGVDVNQHHDFFGPALIAGIKGSSSEAVESLLQHHVDVNNTSSEHGTPSHLACKMQNMGCLQLVLQHRAFVDHVTPSFGTALHMAYEEQDRKLAEILLQHGANMNVSIPGKGTPMHIACRRSDEEMLKLLLSYGADADIVSPELGAALHITVKSDCSDLVKILLEHGTNVNILSSNHGTPLYVACKGYGQDAIIQLLLKYGANVNSKRCNGETPLTSTLFQYDNIFTRELIEALLRSEQQLDITEHNLEMSVTKSADTLRLLLARASHIEITLEMLMATNSVGNFMLLVQHGSGNTITADRMQAPRTSLQLDLLEFWVEFAPEVKPPTAVIKAIRAILNQPEPETPLSELEPRGEYIRKKWIALAKDTLELIVTRYPDVDVPSGTTAAKGSSKSDPTD